MLDFNYHHFTFRVIGRGQDEHVENVSLALPWKTVASVIFARYYKLLQLGLSFNDYGTKGYMQMTDWLFKSMTDWDLADCNEWLADWRAVLLAGWAEN